MWKQAHVAEVSVSLNPLRGREAIHVWGKESRKMTRTEELLAQSLHGDHSNSDSSTQWHIQEEARETVVCLQEELWTLRHEGLMVSEVLREL